MMAEARLLRGRRRFADVLFCFFPPSTFHHPFFLLTIFRCWCRLMQTLRMDLLSQVLNLQLMHRILCEKVQV